MSRRKDRREGGRGGGKKEGGGREEEGEGGRSVEEQPSPWVSSVPGFLPTPTPNFPSTNTISKFF